MKQLLRLTNLNMRFKTKKHQTSETVSKNSYLRSEAGNSNSVGRVSSTIITKVMVKVKAIKEILWFG